MIESAYEPLHWDSEFFGFPIARITMPSAPQSALATLLDQLRLRRIKLAYWSCDPADEVGNAAAIACGGLLVDHKYLFTIQLSAVTQLPPRPLDVGPRITTEDDEGLLELAPQCSEYSRFRVDLNMPEGSADRLYRTWMRRSLDGQKADSVLVKRIANAVAGFITLSIVDGKGEIGLLGVDVGHRGTGIGSSLMSSALHWFSERACASISVVTQGDNLGARRLYERFGFAVQDRKNFFHFWIDSPHDSI